VNFLEKSDFWRDGLGVRYQLQWRVIETPGGEAMPTSHVFAAR
jgi:hypothetical protein